MARTFVVHFFHPGMRQLCCGRTMVGAQWSHRRDAATCPECLDRIVRAGEAVASAAAPPVKSAATPAGPGEAFLDDGAHPVELTSLLRSRDQVARHRNLFCDEYEACLDEAIRREWVSWTCARCERAPIRVPRADELLHL